MQNLSSVCKDVWLFSAQAVSAWHTAWVIRAEKGNHKFPASGKTFSLYCLHDEWASEPDTKHSVLPLNGNIFWGEGGHNSYYLNANVFSYISYRHVYAWLNIASHLQSCLKQPKTRVQNIFCSQSWGHYDLSK